MVEEDRTPLIADLVAGKLDVREAAAQLPDDTDNEGRVEEGSQMAETGRRHLRRRGRAGNCRGGENMIDWSKCPAVEQIPGKVSGAWLFTDSRLPVSALFENLEAGATVEEFMEWFAPVDEWKVRAVLQHLADSLKAPVPVGSLEGTV